jgi:energy-coupling factor transporter ATP-binding protein EcfA2
MKLLEVSIHGFRSIRHLDSLSLGSPTVLAGHNDAGKSAIINAILFLLDSYEITDSDRTLMSEEAGGGSEKAEGEPRRIEETWVSGVFRSEDQTTSDSQPPIVHVRRVFRGESKPYYEYLSDVPDDERLRGLSALTVPELKKRIGDLSLKSQGTKKEDFVKTLTEAASMAPSSKCWTEAPSHILKELPEGRRFDASSAVDAEVAVKDLLTTKYRAHLRSDALQGGVKKIEQQLEGLLVDDAAAMREYIMDKVSDIGAVEISPVVNFASSNGLKATTVTIRSHIGEEVNLSYSGAGRARRIALAIWEYNASLLADSGNDIVLLYDEPDTHLDYSHQRELMALIHEQTENPRLTVVIASHSMSLIDGTDISDVVHVRHENHRTVMERLADDSDVGSHLGAIAASVGLRNTVLLHERLFVGVEGESEARALPVLFKLAMGRHLESCGIAIWPCDNNEGARSFASFLHRHGRNVAFLVDEDSKLNSKHVFSPSKLKKAGLDPDSQCFYVGNPNEIEDTFSDEQWAFVANLRWKRTVGDCESWAPSDFTQHREGKFSQSILEMLRNDSESAPTGKPDMLSEMSLSLASERDVPRDLREKFRMLMELAN